MKKLKSGKKFFLLQAVIILLTFLSCSKNSEYLPKEQSVIVEEYAKENGLKAEVCSRCGYTSLKMKNGDIVLIHWDSPYVDFQNKKGRIKLKNKNRYEKGLTYTDPSLFSKITKN